MYCWLCRARLYSCEPPNDLFSVKTSVMQPKNSDEPNNSILLYQDKDGKTNVSVRFADELPREATIKKFFIVQLGGAKRYKNFEFFCGKRPIACKSLSK